MEAYDIFDFGCVSGDIGPEHRKLPSIGDTTSAGKKMRIHVYIWGVACRGLGHLIGN